MGTNQACDCVEPVDRIERQQAYRRGAGSPAWNQQDVIRRGAGTRTTIRTISVSARAPTDPPAREFTDVWPSQLERVFYPINANASQVDVLRRSGLKCRVGEVRHGRSN